MVEERKPLLALANLTIKFGGNVAVNNVNLAVLPYQFVSVIGPNGAGKTTLFNMISGQYQATDGTIHLKGKDITALGVAETAQLGVGRSFQLAAYYPNLSILENVCLAIQFVNKSGWCFWKKTDAFPEFEDQAYEILKQVFLEAKWNHFAATLSHGEQRKLEIAILLGLDPEIMLLDEPTAGMS
ncbi:MAG: ATP-binding cassette domain-containing protein, partial [SAR324 cluster bacterium]|nr:ATP-binding cassette domain-containing protein [SAR324 cluster bacterium]